MVLSESTELAGSMRSEDGSSSAPPAGPTLSMLSDMSADGRLFLPRTELMTQPEELNGSSMIRDGRALRTTQSRPAGSPIGSLPQRDLTVLIGKQHHLTDARQRAKLERAQSQGEPQQDDHQPRENGRGRYLRLFKDGWTHCHNGDFRAAVQAWDEACAIDPGNVVLQGMLRVLRERLDS